MVSVKEKKQPKKQVVAKPASPFEEELGFEWSDEWKLPEKTGTHIQEDWLKVLEAVIIDLEDAGKEPPSDEDIISIVIPELFEEKLPTWEDYITKAITLIESAE